MRDVTTGNATVMLFPSFTMWHHRQIVNVTSTSVNAQLYIMRMRHRMSSELTHDTINELIMLTICYSVISHVHSDVTLTEALSI